MSVESYDFTVKLGDTGAEIAAILKANALAVDLTGATVKFLMKAASLTGAAKVDAAATIVDAATGSVKYAFTAGDLDTAGSWLGEFEVTDASSRIATYPSAGYIKISIVQDLG